MSIVIYLIKSILGYFVLMLIGTNLLGIVVRGLIPSYKKDEFGNLQLAEGVNTRMYIFTTIISTLVSFLYIYALYYYWNIGIAIAGVMLMISRLPDLLYEMRTGEKVTLKNMPKRPLDIIFTLLSWGALPLIWYSLYYLN